VRTKTCSSSKKILLKFLTDLADLRGRFGFNFFSSTGVQVTVLVCDGSVDGCVGVSKENSLSEEEEKKLNIFQPFFLQRIFGQ
jgi:hypothetical protein